MVHWKQMVNLIIILLVRYFQYRMEVLIQVILLNGISKIMLYGLNIKSTQLFFLRMLDAPVLSKDSIDGCILFGYNIVNTSFSYQIFMTSTNQLNW